jgi:hypothetical protein
VRIGGVIPSEHNPYAFVNPTTDGSIYEISAQDGAVLRRFEMSDGRSASGVACVHEGKFLSFEHGEGKLIPLVGTAEPAASTDSQEQAKPGSPKN